MSSQTAKKTASKAKTSAKKPTVAGLTVELKALETRLKRADTQNRNALKSLDAVVSELANSAKTSKSTQKAALTRGLNTLEKKLKSHFKTASADVHSDIRKELSQVTASGAGLETLEQALSAAHQKIDLHDAVQREAVAKLNRHIADLAAAVDARLSAETQARQKDSADLSAELTKTEARIEQRIDRVEDDTAAALNKIGDKVTEFAAVLDDRARQSDAETAERLADLAKETQADFNYAQTDVSTRLEALETIAAEWSPASTPQPYIAANNDDPRVDELTHTLAQLQDEIARLHGRIAAVQSAPEPQSNVYPIVKSTPPVGAVPMPILRDDNPYAAAYTAHTEPQTIAVKQEKKRKTRESHVPVEFDPAAFTRPSQAVPQQEESMSTAPTYASSNFSPPNLAPSLPPVPQMPPPLVNQGPPQLPPMASIGGYSPEVPSLPPMADTLAPPLSAPMPVQTYDNPAYADGDDMRAERVGGEASRKPSLPALGKLPISGRNLRTGALAASVLVVGLLAAKTILGSEPAPNPIASSDLTGSLNAASDQEMASDMILLEPGIEANASTNILAADSSTPPLGTYTDIATPEISDTGQSTLAAAVNEGNPIAQFQMGLNKLQAGETEEAARLIRLAANRNQPAAQYRLAKLYETGTGVAKDPITARELVERAAIGGNRIAMHDLGNYHFYGQGGLERDPALALEWFTKAAERGVVDSQFNVAFLREGGQGIAEDNSVAYFWYNIAAQQGDQGAPARVLAIGPLLDESTRAKIEADATRFTPKPVDEAANGLFRDVPWAAKTAKVDNSANAKARAARITRVKSAQTLLTDLGFDIGSADGAAGPKTKAAIREFQKVNGMPETGEVSDDLIDRLEIAAGV